MIKKNYKKILLSLILSTISFFISYLQLFSSVDYMLTDRLYSKLSATNRDVMVIGIDEETLTEYGSFTSWSRQKTADLINYLYKDSENAPTALGVDILFQGNLSDEIDNNLANACKNRSGIVFANYLNFKPVVNIEKNEYDPYNISMVEFPYDSLNKNVESGYTNSFLTKDGVSRISVYNFDYNDKKLYSFAYKLADIYAKKNNIVLPEIHSTNNMFRFFYSAKQKEFSYVSLKKVLDGGVPNSEFKNKVVFLGAYATGMQDEYYPTFDVGGEMNGVEIHANIFQALLEGKTAIMVDKLVYSLLFAFIVFIVSLICHYFNLYISIITSIIPMIVNIFLGRYFSDIGIVIPLIYCFCVFGFIVFYSIVRHFLVEQRKRKHVTRVFNRYMDPKLVNSLVKDERNKITLIGEKRNVSVLFVDIRGFTSMSESMDPVDVVGVLNEYLGHVTDCIFKHNGMLDKFIGDAAMAVFNAPIDQDDYIFESVAAAYDIAAGSQEISDKLYKKYGKSISYGIGIHCGEAVIGNIGCKTRMDYTAIGDTVNTASRIESKAGKGEILISVDVKNKLDNRIIVEDAGKLELKGKSEPISVYRVIDVVNV